MDYFPENILLEITALLNAPHPPRDTGEDWSRSGIAWPEIQQVWWLECFLERGPEAFREHLLSRPLPEQQTLAARIFCWFLYRPRLQRLYSDRPGPPIGVRWALARGGSLVSLAGVEQEGVPAGIYYIFPHSRIWPDLLNLPDWPRFLDQTLLQDLEPELALATRSRLAPVRDRSHRLRALLYRPGPTDAETLPLPEAQTPPPPVDPGKKRGRRKKADGQLRLFD